MVSDIEQVSLTEMNKTVAHPFSVLVYLSGVVVTNDSLST